LTADSIEKTEPAKRRKQVEPQEIAFQVEDRSFINQRTALSNQQVLRRISDIDHVFQPTPQQKPISTASFIMEYSVSPLPTKETPAITPISPITPADNIIDVTAIDHELVEFHSDRNDLTALDSLNRLLDENFIQDQQFIDDFIISEHAFPVTHGSYRSALMQVPVRNTGQPYYDHYTPITESSSDESDDRASDIVSIPRSLTPLPDILIQVPVYRDLFHHFVNVTADALVPVPQIYVNNPFRKVLPRMAMNNPHLLSLVLAYAATNRAKCLNQPEPVEMISRLLKRTFEGLTRSLENEKESKSDTTLATAVMLCSYAVTTSAAEDSWKTHLHGAREIVLARGIANSLSGGILSASQSSHMDPYSPIIGPQPLRVINENVLSNEVVSFLIRVFAYLDVIGALSSSNASSVLTNNEQAHNLWTIPSWNLTQQRQYQDPLFQQSGFGTLMNGDPDVDFLLGIDLNMIPVLSKVSNLARKRRNLDVHADRFNPETRQREEEDLVSEGLELSKILISCCSSGELRRKERIRHNGGLNFDEHKYLLQLKTMNLTFGYAALIHLYRRVLRLPTDSAAVQELVGMITDLLDENIPPGDTIEACMSFPIFTTACEVIDEETRAKYRHRMAGMQRYGFGQVSRAKELMEECWARNEPWTGIMDKLGWGLVLA
jgi:hypothetical protein